MTAHRIDGVLRRYSWGSTSAIQHILGDAPDGRPAAELWFGAHPDDPAPVPERGTTLDELITADPLGMLGESSLDTFGPRLPFLLKILAARTALSIQVHPSMEQARRGYAAEDANGIARDAAQRNYRDSHHKPELLFALGHFEALCGFRPAEQVSASVRALGMPELDFLSVLLDGPDPLRAAFTGLLAPSGAVRARRAAAALAARALADPHGELAPAALAAQDFGDDVGVVLTLLLNHVRLGAGEAIYLGAGTVHAYLRGTGVEIMSNSDNVLRCGLTAKHVDVPALLEITDFSPLAEPRCARTGDVFPVPVPDFRLAAHELERGSSPVPVPGGDARVVLCTAGRVAVTTTAAGSMGGSARERQSDALLLAPGRACFVPATDDARLHGAGTAFVASTGLRVRTGDAIR